MEQVISKYVRDAQKFIFIIPEYNGSYPGIWKTFIDIVPPRYFKDKKAGIIGVSSGHAGNLRGQEHLTGVLHYLKVHVHYNKPKLSGVESLVSADGALTDERSVKVLREHAVAMANF